MRSRGEPVGTQTVAHVHDHCGQVAASAVTGDRDSGWVALVASNFALHPKHRTEHIFDDLIDLSLTSQPPP